MPLEGTPPVQPSPTDIECADQQQIKPNETVNEEGCAVLPKLRVHDIQQGQDARLEWNMLNKQGEAVNLTECGFTDESIGSTDGSTFDAIGNPCCGVTLRLREITGFNPSRNCVYQVDVDVLDAGTGYCRASSLPTKVTRVPGIYWEEWAAFDASGNMLFSNQVLLWVNKGLFGLSNNMSDWNKGPPSLDEIRLSIRDNSPEDNLLLDNIEFDAGEIAQAVVRPLQHWNEVPPPLRPPQDTTTFPFREHWLQGIQGYLLQTAAHNYRRNHLPYNAGGVAIDDKNKEGPYLQESRALLQEYRSWVKEKKLEINTALFTGTIGSLYGGLFH
jgi:hypothetical protein